MIKGSLDIKKRLYRDFSFKIGHSYSLTLYGGFFFDHLDATLGKASRSYSTYGFSFQIASLLLGKIPYNLSFYILKDEDR
ncbi:MAG: hypothetical protein C0601_11335 [Candidatus Muiribacterium halophilum]|uniref:Uncharacterized protein n=1 Tax=Muiribacterium halophilum TaxID=2053465 RepID=A0A2N5ZC13_MUIH1|nr:MAG: hypothetical protein C0601_11335 [Candidatus Muirbacterium halophilum]